MALRDSQVISDLGSGQMIGWRFEEVLAVDTREAVTRWWAHRRPSPVAPIPIGLIGDLQEVRVALDDWLQRRLWDLAVLLPEPQRTACKEKIAQLDPWHVLCDMALTECDPTAAERGMADQDHRELIAALKERARRREDLARPRFPSKARRRLRDLAGGRGRLAAVLKDDDACRLLRFGAVLCDLIGVESVRDSEPDLDQIRVLLAAFTAADARRAAEAVLKDPLVGTDDRGRPMESEIKEFVHAMIGAVKRHADHQLTPTISSFAARSPNWDHLPGPDIELVRDLLACHAPKDTEAIAHLIKEA